MSAATSSEDLTHRPTAVRALRPEYRPIFKTNIVLHKLIVIGALTLLPLLAWHHAMNELVEKYDMPRIWEEDFRDERKSKSKVWVWVLMWIFAPVDLLLAILSLGWLHEMLYPRTDDGDAADGDASEDENGIAKDNQQGDTVTEHHTSETPPVRHDSSAVTASKYGSIKPRFHPKRRQTNLLTPHTYHPLLRPAIPPWRGFLLLIAYDTLLTFIYAAHIYTYITSMAPSWNLCRSPWLRPETFKHYKEMKFIIEDGNMLDLDFIQRCHRLNWFIHIAGGFASALAATLATLHVLTLAVRLCEVVLTFMHYMRKYINDMQVLNREWEHAPRDVDIHTRASPRATLGRLSRISEEERSTGIEGARRRHTDKTRSTGLEGVSRRHTDKAAGSASWVGSGEEGGEKKLEHALLECLL